MPLTKFQLTIAKLLSVNRTPESYLAGGSALYFEPNTFRYSNDLDYFHDSEDQVDRAFAADLELIKKSKYQIEIQIKKNGYIRAVVKKGQEATKIEWAQDSAWRFMPVVKHPDAGYLLHPLDLATNKVLALAGRDEARDFLDIIEAHSNILPLGVLVWAAVGKDPGFTPDSLLELLKRRGKYRPDDFKRLALKSTPVLTDLKDTWLRAIEVTESLFNILKSIEPGCLFFDKQQKTFVCPTQDNLNSLIKHYASIGGVLPKIS